MSDINVFPNIVALPKHRVKALLSAGWARSIASIGAGGKATFADRCDTTERTIDNGLSQNTLPEAHTIFNSLAADTTALDEILAEYGFQLIPIHARAEDDLALAGDLSDVTCDLIRGRGKRSPRDTLNLADKLRPLINAEEAIVREADHLRGLH